MLSRFILLLTIVFLTTCGFAQIIDTVYFDKDWNKTDSKKYRFYRIAEMEDSIIKIRDYYSNRRIQFTGTIALDFNQIYIGNLTTTTGKGFFYNKKGRIYLMIDNDVEEYLKLLSDIDKTEFVNDSVKNLFYYERYYNNGKINERGFLSDNCTPHYSSWWFNKKGMIKWVNNYKNGDLNGFVDWYFKGNHVYRWNYKNGMKNGEYFYYDKRYQNIRESGSYVNDRKHGEFKFYDRYNNLKKIIIYDNGEKITMVR